MSRRGPTQSYEVSGKMNMEYFGTVGYQVAGQSGGVCSGET
jgi:hypothetical protein